MTLNEEVDKIILDNAGSCSESSSMCKIKSEILALFERKLNEKVISLKQLESDVILACESGEYKNLSLAGFKLIMGKIYEVLEGK